MSARRRGARGFGGDELDRWLTPLLARTGKTIDQLQRFDSVDWGAVLRSLAQARGSVVQIAADFDAIGAEGFTLMHVAVATANRSLLSLILSFGESVHLPTHCTNMTPLLVAALAHLVEGGDGLLLGGALPVHLARVVLKVATQPLDEVERSGGRGFRRL